MGINVEGWNHLRDPEEFIGISRSRTRIKIKTRPRPKTRPKNAGETIIIQMQWKNTSHVLS
jgi:hypothetical protein